MSRSNDLLGVFRGLEKVAQAAANHQLTEIQQAWKNSSIKSALSDVGVRIEEKISDSVISHSNIKENVDKAATEVTKKGPSAVIKSFATSVLPSSLTTPPNPSKIIQAATEALNRGPSETIQNLAKKFPFPAAHTAKSPTSSPGSAHNQLQHKPSAALSSTATQTNVTSTEQLDEEFKAAEIWLRQQEHIKEAAADVTGDAWLQQYTALLQKESEIVKKTKIKPEKGSPLDSSPGHGPESTTTKISVPKAAPSPPLPPTKVLTNERAKPLSQDFQHTLSKHAHERRVPSSRLGRMATFGSLAAGLGMGAMAELARRSVGLKETRAKTAIFDDNPLLTEANVERIVKTLCRVRGAALKLGQMLSIQDNSLISPELQKIFERVRQSADFMPAWQMKKVLRKELGEDWTTKVKTFDEKPFAAASIGQVHRAVLLDGRQVAMKIQYPGIASSIDSDIDNLLGILKVWKVLPDGLYAEKAMEVARMELAWECDYKREAECSRRFRRLLANDAVFYVPEVISELSTGQVLTTELVSGVTLDQCVGMDQGIRNFVGENILRLCLIELFEFNFMQTDPNWSNFLYDSSTKSISLLDFGASREYSRKFTDNYLRVVHAASEGNREKVLEYSIALGFLSGYEAQVMKNVHIDSVMILGEAFASRTPFDFGLQTTAARIHKLIPTMLKHRLIPPPEETYSLHRKMSGCFLLCTKLGSKITCKDMFNSIYQTYQFGLGKEL